MSTGRPLEGRRVLVPRGGPWGERVCRLLAEHGAQGVVVPLIAFEPPADPAALDAAIARLGAGSYTWLVLTSATTVQALAARAPALVGRTVDHGALRTVVGVTRVAAVGPGTSRALAEHRVRPALVPTGERSGAGLVAEFPRAPRDRNLTGRSALVPRSDLAEPTVVEGLRAKGWVVDDVVAYRTVPGDVTAEAREDVRAGWFDAVLLTSASTVRHLVALAGPPPPRTTVAVIGPRTRAAAEAAGLAVAVQPEHASAEELVDALARHLARAVPEEQP